MSKRVNFTVQPDLVCIELKVFNAPPWSHVDDDRELITELLKWLIDEGIHSFHTPFSGGGSMKAYFHEDDAIRVVEWLKENSDA